MAHSDRRESRRRVTVYRASLVLRLTCLGLFAFFIVVTPLILNADPSCDLAWDAASVPPMDGVTLALTSWDPDGGGTQPPVLVAGGYFTSVGGVSANNIATWNGAFWQGMGAGVNGVVYSAVVLAGELIVGGEFTQAGGLPVGYIARWNGVEWLPMGKGMDNWVTALAVYNGDLIAGGYFTIAGGSSAARLARWDGVSWHPLSTGVNNTVNCLEVYNGELIIGGRFSSAGGIGASRIARWSGSSF